VELKKSEEEGRGRKDCRPYMKSLRANDRPAVERKKGPLEEGEDQRIVPQTHLR